MSEETLLQKDLDCIRDFISTAPHIRTIKLSPKSFTRIKSYLIKNGHAGTKDKTLYFENREICKG